jgi:signal transduction histidine kinase
VLKLRGALLACLGAVSIICVAVVGTLDAVTIYEEASNRVLAAQEAKVRVASVRIEESLSRVQRVAAEVFSLPLDGELLPASEAGTELQRLLKLLPEVDAATYRARGAVAPVVARRTTGAADSLLSVTRDLAMAWSRHGAWTTSATQFIDGNRPFVLMCFCDPGNGAWALIRLNLKFLGRAIEPLSEGGREHLYVLDRSGNVLAHTDYSLAIRRLRVALDALVGENPRRQAGDAARIVKGGGLSFKSAVRVAQTSQSFEYVVVSEAPAQQLFAPVWRLVLTSSAYFLGLLLVLWLLSGYVASKLSIPFERIKKASAEMATGDLAIRLAPSNIEEIDAVGRSLNSMAAQLQSYTTGLEQKVAEKTIELERANRHKSEFLANMSHELRTPLNAVIGFSEALKAEYFGALNAKQMEYVKDINASGQHLLSLINDILDLSKVEAGKMELTVTRFDMAAAIDNALTLVRERALKHRIHLKAEIAPDLGVLTADERKVKQILINLLSNAVKFSHPDGDVTVAARREGGCVMVAVRDSGIGIAAQDLTAIFDEFRQVGATGSAKAEGSGLGLTLSKRFVELHGGRIEVASKVGKGSVFTFWLPDPALLSMEASGADTA